MRNLIVAGSILACAGFASGDVIGLVDFDGTEMGLTGYTNPAMTYSGTGLGTDALQCSSDNGSSSLWGPGDACWPMTRAAVGPNLDSMGLPIGMPFAVSDDGVEAAAGNSVFETDTGGFAGIAQNTNGFFGVCDANNSVQVDPIVVDFVFDVTGATDLSVSMDFAAMGDFEASFDITTIEYSVDGSAFASLFAVTIDEAIDQTYIMDNGATPPVVLNDPMLIDGTLLDDNFQTFSSAIAETGASLTIRITTNQDSGTEAWGIDNIMVEGTTGGGGLALSIDTSCPAAGPATLTATGGSGGNVGFVYSMNAGMFTVPSGICAGTTLDIGAPVTLGGVGSGNPAVLNVPNAPGVACGNVLVQAVDASTCETSNVVTFGM